MTIPLTGAGGLFVRLGHLTQALQDYLALHGSLATANVPSAAQLTTRLTTFETDFANGTPAYGVIDGFVSNLQAAEQGTSSLAGVLQTISQNLLVTMASQDTGLTGLTFPAALSILVSQMTGSNLASPVATMSQTVPAVGTQTNVGSPTGNPTFIFSVTDGTGRTMQFIYPETLTATITQDSQNGATAGQEPWLLYGYPGQQNKLAIDWLANKSGVTMNQTPYGSGANAAGNLVDGSAGNQGGFGNVTVNGDFRTYTNTNYPDNWIAVTGTVGTMITNGSGTSYLTGGGSVLLNSTDAATLVAIAQQFNTASTTGAGTGGSPYVMLAGNTNNAVYCASVYYKSQSNAANTASLLMAITDGTNPGAVQNNDLGTALSTSVALPNDANWHQLTLVFSLPAVLPANVRLRLSLSGTQTAGKGVYLANCAVCQMAQFYNGGPYVAGFRGSTNVQAAKPQADAWTFAVTCTVAGNGINQTTAVASAARAIWRLWDPANQPAPPQGSAFFSKGNGYYIPNAADGSATFTNALVV